MSDKEFRIKIKIGSEYKEVSLAKNEVDKISSSLNTAETSTETFYRKLGNTTAVVAGLVAIKETLVDSALNGFEYNKTIEKLTNSLTTLYAVTSSSVSTTGRALSLEEKYNLARKESLETIKELEDVNTRTPHTLEQTVAIYNAMLPSMRKLNVSNEDLIQLTEKISIAAKAGTIEFQQLLAGVDGLATGTILSNSELGRFLGSIGLTNEALKETDDIVGLVNEKFKDIKAIEDYDNSISNLENSFNELTGKLTQNAFEKSKEYIKDITSTIKVLNNNVELISDVSGEIVHLTLAAGGAYTAYKTWNTSIKIYNSLVGTTITQTDILGRKITTTTNRIKLSTIATKGLSAALKITPFALATTAIYLLSDALIDNADKAEILEKAYDGVSENLESLTKNQLEYKQSLIETELIEARLKLANAKADASNQGFFESDEEHKKDLAYVDELSKKFENLTKASRETKKALINISTKEIKSGSVKKVAEKLKRNTKTLKDFSSEEEKTLANSDKMWQSYYEKTGEYQEAWYYEEAKLMDQYFDLNEEAYTKLIEVARKEYFDKFRKEQKQIFTEFEAAIRSATSLSEIDNLTIEAEIDLGVNATSAETNKLYKTVDEAKQALYENTSYYKSLQSYEDEVINEWTIALEKNPSKVNDVNKFYISELKKAQEKDVARRKDLNNDFLTNFSDSMVSSISSMAAGSLTSLAQGGNFNGKSILSSLGGLSTNIGMGGISTALAAGTAIPVWGWAAAAGGMIASALGSDSQKQDNSEALVAMGAALADKLINDMGYGNNPLDDFNSAIQEATKTLAEFNNDGSGLSVKIKTLLTTEEYQNNKAEDLNDEYLNTVNTALMFAFTETGAMYAGMAARLKAASEAATATAEAAHSELESTLLDSASSTLNYSLYSIEELNGLIKEIDYQKYENTVKSINDIAIQIKNTGLMTEEQMGALASLYKEENFINYQDAQDIKEAINNIKESILSLSTAADEFEISFSALDDTSLLELEQTTRQISNLKLSFSELSSVTRDNFLELFRSIDPSDTNLIDKYTRLGNLLQEQALLQEKIANYSVSAFETIESFINPDKQYNEALEYFGLNDSSSLESIKDAMTNFDTNNIDTSTELEKFSNYFEELNKKLEEGITELNTQAETEKANLLERLNTLQEDYTNRKEELEERKETIYEESEALKDTFLDISEALEDTYDSIIKKTSAANDFTVEQYSSLYSEIQDGIESGTDVSNLTSSFNTSANEYADYIANTSLTKTEYEERMLTLANEVKSLANLSQSVSLTDINNTFKDELDDIDAQLQSLEVSYQNSIEFATLRTNEKLDQINNTLEAADDTFENSLEEISLAFTDAVSDLGSTLEAVLTQDVNSSLIDLITYNTNYGNFSLDDLLTYSDSIMNQEQALELYNAIKSTGVTANEFDELMGWESGSLNTWAEKFNLPAFANGGIVTKPMVGLIGEAGYDEAIIPLDGRDALGMQKLLSRFNSLNDDVNILIKITVTQAELISNMKSNSNRQNQTFDKMLKELKRIGA